MSSPGEFYNSFPPVTKAYGTLCLLTTAAYHLGLLNPLYNAFVFTHFKILILLFRTILMALSHLITMDNLFHYKFLKVSGSQFWKCCVKVWRLITSFFFLGIAKYGMQLENGPFDKRTTDFLWMMVFGAFSLLVLSAIPWFSCPFSGVPLVFMLLYIWSREFPNAQVNIYGLITLKAFYLPWAMLALDVLFGVSPLPDLMGIIVGHLYYFLTVLHPLTGGRNILKTPMWLETDYFHVGQHEDNKGMELQA